MGNNTLTELPLWRRRAYELFPELTPIFDRTDSPYLLWYELQLAFDAAYEIGDRSTISRIYQYARWCCDQPRGDTAADDLLTCVVVNFFEDIPLNEKAVNDLPNWLSRGEIEVMKETFMYQGGLAGYNKILKSYD